jgi:hypothetical protein
MQLITAFTGALLLAHTMGAGLCLPKQTGRQFSQSAAKAQPHAATAVAVEDPQCCMREQFHEERRVTCSDHANASDSESLSTEPIRCGPTPSNVYCCNSLVVSMTSDTSRRRH